MQDISTIIEQFLSYNVHLQNYSKSTISSYRSTFGMFLRETWITKLSEFRESLVETWLLDWRIHKSWLPNTYLTYHKHFSGFCKWLLKKKMIEENFMKQIEKPKLEQRLPRRLNRDQSEIVLQAVASFRYKYRFEKQRNMAIIACMIFWWLRRNEALSLRIWDVDLDNSVIRIVQGKGKKDRMIPVCSRLHGIIKIYLRERERLWKTCEYFFVTSQYDTKTTKKCLTRLISRLREKTWFDFSAHSLRHSFATMMIEGWCDIYTLSKIMGHSRITTTTIYLSCSVESMLKSIEKHPLN